MSRTKKTTASAANIDPVITRGSHSTRTVHSNGRIEFETHWDELVRDVTAATSSINSSEPATQSTPSKPSRTRKGK